LQRATIYDASLNFWFEHQPPLAPPLLQDPLSTTRAFFQNVADHELGRIQQFAFGYLSPTRNDPAVVHEYLTDINVLLTDYHSLEMRMHHTTYTTNIRNMLAAEENLDLLLEGGITPITRYKYNDRGRRYVDIPRETLKFYLDEGLKLRWIAEQLGVSSATLSRTKKQYGLTSRRRNWSDISSDELEAKLIAMRLVILIVKLGWMRAALLGSY
jgi:AraC-like DNA-binding protein